MSRPRGYRIPIDEVWDDDWDEEAEEMIREDKRRSKYFTQYAIEQGNRFRPTSNKNQNYHQVIMLGAVTIMVFL